MLIRTQESVLIYNLKFLLIYVSSIYRRIQIFIHSTIEQKIILLYVYDNVKVKF